MKTIEEKAILLVLTFCVAVSVYGQAPATLKIGDAAPELKVIWIKGSPVLRFDRDMLYVVEFWATWCGPCKAVMPHLSELAKKYRDDITFIGVNVWEDHNSGKAPYEDVLPAVKKFVANAGEKMAYHVAMDKNDRYMSTQWMKAADQNGIPATFLVKDDTIIWIGNPRKLDTVLANVMTGTYEMAEYVKEFNEQNNRNQEVQDSYRDLQTRVQVAMKAKDHAEAINAIDNAIATINASLKSTVYQLKFTTLLQFDVLQAVAFAKGSKKDIPFLGTWAAHTIQNAQGLPTEAYRFSLDVFTSALSTSKGAAVPIIHNLIAECYFKMNDLGNAISAKGQAIETGKKVIAEEKDQPAFNNGTIQQYKEELAAYKAAYKKDWPGFEKTVIHLVNTYLMNNPARLASYAWCFYDNKQIRSEASLREAVKWINRAITQDNSLNNRAIRAALLFKAGRKKQALPIAEEILHQYDETGTHSEVAVRLSEETKK